MTDPRRAQQLRTAINDLEATIRGEKGKVADLRAMGRSDVESTIRNLLLDIRHNEEQIKQLRIELNA
ncbi:hypothetical protein HDC34_002547 [Pseudoclavibacter sp. JAI123]|uniref:hypothetical protein n=1 Tax=Pseudoclavibacter sp. JAI123 TaxID=2723065 RepID=UPI0015CAD5B9|nr:hypothetical protein [Pseudoclavibacter sp. JAI123]NYF14220.1 hypothetical protein [Pseudoclavibacter sp. JAI123]